MASKSRIIVLDEETIAQIAAGEVIERPASVVKELVENALDAGSTRIHIELKKGGLKLIRVSDNGCGMSGEELQLAVQRHATSKIQNSSDLWKITTLGFRGEALPSIAAVSRLEIISRPAEEVSGYRLYIEGGSICHLEAAASPAGTRVTVSDLFYNLPVRRQFQKTPAAELTRIADLLGRIALAFPEVSFCLQQEGKIIFQTPGNGRLQETIASLYGSDLAASLLEVKAASADSVVKVQGYVSPPSWTWNNRQRQTFIVNRRYIQSPILSLMLEDAYRGRIAAKRYPIAVLHLELPPGQVDVNIHPSKMEIRFRNERAVYHALAEAVNRTLQQSPAVSSFWLPLPDSEEPFASQGRKVTAADIYFDRGEISAKNNLGTEEKSPAEEEPSSKENWHLGKNWHTHKNIPAPTRMPDYHHKEVRFFFKESAGQETGESTLPAAREPAPAASAGPGDFCSLGELQPLGQIIADTYIAASGSDGLYLIDQHAAHERIIYEELLSSIQSAQNSSQILIFPEIIKLSPAEKTMLQKNHTLFLRLGFMLKEGEENSLLLEGVPNWCAAAGKEAFLELLGWLSHELPSSHPPAIETVIAHLACRQARKAGEKISREEIESLLFQLEKCSNPYSCPHGRPTVVRFSALEIAKRFLRSGL